MKYFVFYPIYPNDKVYQLLPYGRWISTGAPASSSTKTGLHDIAEILLKVALNIINQEQTTQWSKEKGQKDKQ
jgi:hypothetical protein